MTTKAKYQLSREIAKILKKNDFYRLTGRWYGSGREHQLHICIQPEGLFKPDFDGWQAGKNFERSIRQIRALPKVKKAGSCNYTVSGWKPMSGILIYT